MNFWNYELLESKEPLRDTEIKFISRAALGVLAAKNTPCFKLASNMDQVSGKRVVKGIFK